MKKVFESLYSQVRRPLIYLERYRLWKRTETYIISYPKSGRTWMRFFLREYLQKKYDVEIPLNFRILKDPVENFPRIYFSHYGFDGEIKNRNRLATVDRNVKKVKQNTKELHNKDVLFLARDPRDTVVSFYFYLAHNLKQCGVDQMTIGDYLRNEDLGLPWIIEYMNAWYEERATFRNFKLLSYEECRNDPQTKFAEVLEFAGAKIDTDLIAEVEEAYRFENMKRKEANDEFGELLRPVNPADPEASFVRKGKVGGYREYFNEDDLAFANEQMKKLHPDFGYTP